MNKLLNKQISKLPHIGTTIFTIMSKLAQEHNAINLSQGFPDFEPDKSLIDRVSYYLNHGKNQYPPMIGVDVLRRAVSAKLRATRGLDINPDTEITITSGATEALFCAIHAVVREGDEVIVFDPAFDSYQPAVSLAGGKTIHVPLVPDDFGIDWAALEAALNANTRLVIINSPHNPTGSILTGEDMRKLADLITPWSCYLLSDEVYEHIIFDGQPHVGAMDVPSLKGRSFSIYSFGKTYHVTGWKVGYCVAPPALTEEFRKIHQFNTFTTNTPMQWALADIVADQPRQYLDLSDFYQKKRDLYFALLEDSRFSLSPSRGTYFQLANYSAISNLPDMEFARWLTVEKGVAVIPLSPFYRQAPDSRLVRFCFAKQDATLEKAANILRSIDS